MSLVLTTESPPLQTSQKTLSAIILSIVYALFVIFIPWEEVSRGGFTDFNQYVEYFDYFYNKNDISFAEVYQLSDEAYQFSTLKEFFSHEVIWFELMRWLTSVTGEAAISLRIISFFILFVWGLFLFSRVNFGMAILFLFNPFAIDVAMSGIRNGLAWSLVLIGLTTHSRVWRAALFLPAIFIHSSTIVLIIFYYFTEWASRFIKERVLIFTSLGIGIFMGLALTVGSEFVLGAIGDRRQGENYLVGGGSLLQASLWGILLYMQCKSGRDYIRKNAFVIAVLAWYLTMNPFIPWSYRIWGAFLPVIAFSAMNLPDSKRKLFIYLYMGYMALQYFYWSKFLDFWNQT